MMSSATEEHGVMLMSAGLIDQAIQAHKDGKLDEAQDLYSRALQNNPEDARALCYLGALQAQRGKFEQSLELLQRALASDSQFAEAHSHIAAVLQHLKRPIEALIHVDQALSIAPELLDARINRAAILHVLGRTKEAIEQFEAIIAEAPQSAAAQGGLATALEAVGREHEAFVHYRNAARIHPQWTKALDRALIAFASRHPAVAQAGMQRLNAFMKAMVLNHGNPRMGTYPGLTARPFHDRALFPITQALQAQFSTIRNEIAGLADAVFSPELESHLMERGAWDVFMFYERGRKNAENCDRCPTITKIIESHNTLRTQAGILYVSKLVPQSHIRAHRGPTNIRIRCHLGIQIPQGDCAIRVRDEVRRWREGECLIFDDSLEHESWNHTDESRIVLIVDVWHPDLTPAEVAFLEGLHRFGAYQAESLNNYWTAKTRSQAEARKIYD
jgi:aspartate beta-hydroxylase